VSATRQQEIARNLEQVRTRIARAEARVGRPGGQVHLVAVSKTKPLSDIQAALAAGQLDFGENYAQELRDKRLAAQAAAASDSSATTELGRLRWHFIGPLQANKAKYVAGHAALVHTVDSEALMRELDRRTAAAGADRQDCLVQVNVAGEAQKSGVASADLPALLDAFAGFSHLRCVGLMLIPPNASDPEANRPHFRALLRLAEAQAGLPRANVRWDPLQLSMGMSHDLEVAIEEGATLVRVGTAIFGARERKE